MNKKESEVLEVKLMLDVFNYFLKKGKEHFSSTQKVQLIIELLTEWWGRDTAYQFLTKVDTENNRNA